MPEKKKATAEKTRKPYPSLEERLVSVDKEIEHLEKLNAARTELIRKTEATLEERKAALAKSEEALRAALAKKEKIVAAKDKPQKVARKKLSPEALAERRRAVLVKAREARKNQREKMSALMSALAASGKSVDELLSELEEQKK